ncbi:MAG: SusC/RagA family TonB-linked outer membrane protein, partial [Chitinophagaceae bacterium]
FNMRSKFKWIFTLLLAFSLQIAFAQDRTISGVVTEGGLPMPAVNVLVKGTQRAVQTDIDGKFAISAKTGDVLVFTFVGFNDKSVTVGAANTVSVKMDVSDTVLREVEIVNLGNDVTRTKAKTSTSSVTVDGKVLANRPNSTFLTSLQGTAAGVSVTGVSGSPGSSKTDIIIRGIGTISSSTDPLYVIDGVPTNGTQFRNLNPNDIESTTILKDAAATSPYGNKGANGVIVVTTKKGKFGSKMTVTYDGTTGYNFLPENDYNMANSQQLLTLEKRQGVGLGATLTDEEIANYPINTNWRDEFFNTDVVKQHNLGISAGSDNLATYTSINYFEQGGLVPTTNFKRFSLRSNINGKSANGRFTYSTQLSLGFSKRRQLDQEANNGVDNNTIQNPLHGSLFGLPYVEANQFANGQELYNVIGTDFSGPNDTFVLEDVLKGSLPNQYSETSMLVSGAVGYKLTDWLSINNRTGMDYKVTDRIFARTPGAYLSIAVRESRAEQFGGSETMSNVRDFTFTNYASLNFNKVIAGAHTIDAGLYVEYQKVHYQTKTQFQNGLNPATYSFGAGTGYIPFNGATPNSYVSTAGAFKVDAGTLSYFGLLNYDFKSRFGIDASIRRDATYRFIDENKWGTFWSVGGRWNIDREAFMEGSAFSMLKLRASYGTQGNQNIVGNAYGVNPLITGTNIVRDLNNVGGGYNNDPGGYFVAQIANTSAQWEEQSMATIGLDMRLFNDKLEANIDVYEKVTDKLYYIINRSAITSLYSQSGNNGKLSNKGVELNLRYNILRNEDFQVSVFANGAYNKNEVKELTGNQDGQDNVYLPGRIINEFNLIPYAGVNPSNGNLLFYNAAGELTENPDQVADRRLTGKSPFPKYLGGF